VLSSTNFPKSSSVLPSCKLLLRWTDAGSYSSSNSRILRCSLDILEAIVRGVCSLSFLALMLAPASSNIFTAPTRPKFAASCKGVLLLWLSEFTMAPFEMRNAQNWSYFLVGPTGRGCCRVTPPSFRVPLIQETVTIPPKKSKVAGSNWLKLAQSAAVWRRRGPHDAANAGNPRG
jgi:hypothetical protein